MLLLDLYKVNKIYTTETTYLCWHPSKNNLIFTSYSDGNMKTLELKNSNNLLNLLKTNIFLNSFFFLLFMEWNLKRLKPVVEI